MDLVDIRPYLNSLKDKNNILSGDTTLLPEPLLSLHREVENFQNPPMLPWKRATWNQKKKDAIRDFEVEMLSYKFNWDEMVSPKEEINKSNWDPMVDRSKDFSNTSATNSIPTRPLHQELEPYLSTLNNPDDIMSGDFQMLELLETPIGHIYGKLQTKWEEAMQVVNSHLIPEDMEPAKAEFKAAYEEFHTAMRNLEVRLEEEKLLTGSKKTNEYSYNLTQDTIMAKKTTKQQKEHPAPQTPDVETAENTMKMPRGEKSDVENTQRKTPSSQSDTDLQSTRESLKVSVKTEPQMVTVNGAKVSHGHVFESKTTPGNWFFSVKLNGELLKSRHVDPADLEAFQKKEIGIPQMMERYHPTKLMRRLTPEELAAGRTLSDGRTVDKFNFYKETAPDRPDFGKYKMYAQVGDAKMSVLASRDALNSYFDKVATPAQLVETYMGDKLHLKSAYEKYSIPEGVSVTDVSMGKEPNGAWALKAKINGVESAPKTLSFDDYFSFFKTKTATGEQLVAKYFGDEIKLAPNLEKGESIKTPLKSSLKI